MIKHILLIAIVFSLQSCGKRSVIKNAVAPQSLAERYGDGKHVILPVIVPLSDSVISSFESPVGKINSLTRGLAKMFFDLGASMGAGKFQLSMVQPIPSIPTDVIQDIRIKRIFFYIEPVLEKKELTRKQRFVGWFDRTFRGRDNVDFNFLDTLAVKLSPQKLGKINSWTIDGIDQKQLKNKDYAPMQTLFENVDEDDIFRQEEVEDHSDSLVILKYNGEEGQKFVKNAKYGNTYIIAADDPLKTKKFLETNEHFEGIFERIHVLNKSLLVKVNDDALLDETFRSIIANQADSLDEIGGIKNIEPCTATTCLDFKVPDVNLVPLMVKGNGLKIDTFLVAGKVPESFQLMGFLEFEVRMKLPF